MEVCILATELLPPHAHIAEYLVFTYSKLWVWTQKLTISTDRSAMEGKSFGDLFNLELLRYKTVLVDERNPCKCDFLILELVKHFGYSVVSYNEAAVHYRRLFQLNNITGSVCSFYDQDSLDVQEADSESTAIIDYAALYKEFQPNMKKPRVAIYRSNSAQTADYYEYDIIIKIEGLRSGCTERMDGALTVFSRDTIILSLKYKIRDDRSVSVTQ